MSKSVVFLCTENSNRSQMAEGFARHHSGGAFVAHSAGSSPKGEVNPKAIEAMAEKGIDLKEHRSKSTDELPHRRFDAVITMGCGDECPWLEGALREDWGLEDPRDLGPEGYRSVRDEIERRVIDLARRLQRAEAERG
ncbi:MAG: arsenate reductase ArsC [Acidobacteriota bacterium]